VAVPETKCAFGKELYWRMLQLDASLRDHLRFLESGIPHPAQDSSVGSSTGVRFHER